MNRTTIVTLMITITVFTRADSCTPMTSRTVTSPTMIIAGMLMIPVTELKDSYAIWFFARKSLSVSVSTAHPWGVWNFWAISIGIWMIFVPGEAQNCGGMLMPKSR